MTGQLYGVKAMGSVHADPGHSSACRCGAGSLFSSGASCSRRAADGGASERVIAAKRAAFLSLNIKCLKIAEILIRGFDRAHPHEGAILLYEDVLDPFVSQTGKEFG